MMVDSEFKTRHLWITNGGDSQRMHYKDTNNSEDDSARHGQNQEKGKKLRLLH